MKLEIGMNVKSEPKDLGRKLGYEINGEIVQLIDFMKIAVIKYDTGRRGKRKFSTYSVCFDDITEIMK